MSLFAPGPSIIFVMGATATGKSDWALELAEKAGAVIVNADSVQVYRGPRIGSNLPSEQDFQRVPHALYSYVEAPEEMTAGRFREDFFKFVQTTSHRRLIVVGGTGFYFRALEKGLFSSPTVSEAVAAAVREQAASPAGLNDLWSELVLGDGESTTRISKADSYRIVRAVELLRSGVKLSDLQKTFVPQAFPWPLYKLSLVMEREALHRRIVERTARMIEQGLVAETETLLQMSPVDWAPLSAVGYKEVRTFLREGHSREWLQDEIVLRTFQLTKRQNTWFKKEDQTEFLQVEKDRSRFLTLAEKFFEIH